MKGAAANRALARAFAEYLGPEECARLDAACGGRVARLSARNLAWRLLEGGAGREEATDRVALTVAPRAGRDVARRIVEAAAVALDRTR